MTTEFADIVISAGKSKKRGVLSLHGGGDVPAKFTFTSKTKPIDLALADIEFLIWSEVGRGIAEGGFVVKIGLKGSSLVKFSGFVASAYNPLQSWLVSSGKELTIEKVSTRGANWGNLKVSDHRLMFEDKEGLLMFDVPITNIAQSAFQGKQDITIEFPQDDDTKSVQGQLETLCEIRVFVPNDEREAAAAAAAAAADSTMKTEDDEEKRKADEEKKDGEEGDEEEGGEDEEEETAAQILVKDIMSRVGGDDKLVQPIARFNLMFQSPRGKYNIDMYQSYLKLASKTFQYKILYKFIQKMFLFDNPQTSSHFFVIGLNPPVRQGRTPHPYLLVQFDNLDEMEETFNVDEKTCQETYKDIMQVQMKGPSFDIVTRVFKALTDRKVLVPGVAFQSKGGGSCIRCNWKANDGYLYCMEKSFFFVKKPLMHIRHADVVELSFERLSNSSTGSKSFDLRIVTNEEKNNEYVFSSIARDEYQSLFDFLKNKKLNMTSQFEGSMTSSSHGRARLATNYDEEHDPHMNRIQDEQAGSDEGSEEDSDFEGGDSSSSSESGSDVDPEASDDSDAAPAKKAPKKSKKAASSDEEGDDDDGKKKGQKRKRGAAKKPGKPKAKSAYFLYLDDARPKFIADNPELKSDMIQVTKAVAAQWKMLDASLKQPYHDRADAEKARIAAERAASGDVSDDEGKKKKAPRKRSTKNADGKPKAPPTAKALWTDDRKPAAKAEDPSLSAADLKSKLNDEWKSLKEEEKQTWVEQVLAAKKQYKIDLAEWKKRHPADDAAGDDADDGAQASGEDDEDDAAAAARKKEKKRLKKEKKALKKSKKDKKRDKKKDKKKNDAASDASGADDDADMADEEDAAVKPEPMEE